MTFVSLWIEKEKLRVLSSPIIPVFASLLFHSCGLPEYLSLSRICLLLFQEYCDYMDLQSKTSHTAWVLCLLPIKIYTHESRAASHKFYFSHLELHAHTYSLNIHLKKNKTKKTNHQEKELSFQERRYHRLNIHTGTTFLLLVILYSMCLGGRYMHFLFV